LQVKDIPKPLLEMFKTKGGVMIILITLITLVTIALIAWISITLASLAGSWLGILAFVVLATCFVRNGLQKVPANPPYKAVLLFLGKRQNVIFNEGWKWVPFHPFIFNLILINVEKKTYEFGPQKVRTPDNAVISTSEAVIWTPGIQGRPDSFITYLNSGGPEGVRKILRERIEDRVKTWATSNQEGPSDWKEALALRDDAHIVLARALLGKTDQGGALTPVDSDIPTCVWMRFFNKPKSPPTKFDIRNKWATMSDDGSYNWNGLQQEFDGYSPEKKQKLEQQVEARRMEVNQLRGARGNFPDESLGITILGFSVDEIQVEGEVAKAAELAEKERREQEADVIEIDNISKRAAQLRKDHPDLSADEVFKLIQVERNKASRTIIDIGGARTDVGHDLLGLGGIIREIAAAVKSPVRESENQSKGGKKRGKKRPSGKGEEPEELSDAQSERFIKDFASGEDQGRSYDNDEEEDEDEDEDEGKA